MEPVPANKGYTLIEVLLASTVLSIVLVALSALPVTNIRNNGYASRVTAATSLARDKLEELRTVPYAALASSQDGFAMSDTKGIGGSGAIYRREWTVAPGPTATMKNLTVTVSWTDQSAHRVTLQASVSE